MPIRSSEKLDIIIPVYNKEKYLEKCVNSALSQSYAPDTVILADDGSTDGSAALCDKLAAENEMVLSPALPDLGLTVSHVGIVASSMLQPSAALTVID